MKHQQHSSSKALRRWTSSLHSWIVLKGPLYIWTKYDGFTQFTCALRPLAAMRSTTKELPSKDPKDGMIPFLGQGTIPSPQAHRVKVSLWLHVTDSWQLTLNSTKHINHYSSWINHELTITSLSSYDVTLTITITMPPGIWLRAPKCHWSSQCCVSRWLAGHRWRRRVVHHGL